MEELIENIISGNLTAAKRMARRYQAWTIRECLIVRGYSLCKATLTADWLKGRDCKQGAYDAE